MKDGAEEPTLDRAAARYHRLPVASTESSAPSRRRQLRDVLVFGLCGGGLIAVLKLTEYRFLVVERSVEIYGQGWARLCAVQPM